MVDLVERLRYRADEMDRRLGTTGVQADLREAADALEAAMRAVRIESGERNRVQAKWDKCRARLRAAREDGARLDWLDANWFSAYRSCDPIDGLAKHCVVVDESKQPRRGNIGTIREAIDAAREVRNG